MGVSQGFFKKGIIYFAHQKGGHKAGSKTALAKPGMLKTVVSDH